MPIYLDHAATTPLRREALEAMLPYLTDRFGNASSAHSFGRTARAALDDAHERIAAAIGAQPREIVLTSGGSEANNLALKGAAWAGKARGHRIVTSPIEHHSVGHTLRYLEKFGFEVVEVSVDRYGRVDPDEVDAAISPKTILVTVMLANNEVGTIEPVPQIAERVHRHKGVLFHTDAVQAAPYIPIDVRTLGVDLLTLGAHKFEGPKGQGALFIRHGTNILAQQQGGAQERYRRAGTENVAGAVGMATAFELALREREATNARLRELRSSLQATVLANEGVELTGHPTDRLPGLSSVVVRDVEGASLVLALDLDGVACSTGSACESGSTETSHVLRAMAFPDEEARGALRLSLGRTTSEADVVEAGRLVSGAIARQKAGAATLRAANVEVAAHHAGALSADHGAIAE